MQVAAVVVEVAVVVAVGDEHGVKWWRWGGCSMAMVATAFDDGGYGLRMGDVEVKMAIDTSGGGWFEAKLEIDTSGLAGGDSGRQCLTAVMDEGGRSCLTLASVVDGISNGLRQGDG